MRTIVSGIMLAEAVDAELEIVWFRDWGLGCRYDALLQPIDLPFVRVREATALDLLLRDHPRRRNLYACGFPAAAPLWRKLLLRNVSACSVRSRTYNS